MTTSKIDTGEFKIEKIIVNPNLRTPDSYTVRCGGKQAYFKKGDELKVGEWILDTWKDDFIPPVAEVYYNIDWDCDNVLYCKYRYIG